MSTQPTPEPKDLSHIYRRMTADRLEEIGGFELPANIPAYWKQTIHDLWQEVAARFEIDENAQLEAEKLKVLSPGSSVTLRGGERWTWNGQYWHDGERPSFDGESISDGSLRPFLESAIRDGAVVSLAEEREA